MIYVPKTADQAFDTYRPQISEPNHLQKKTLPKRKLGTDDRQCKSIDFLSRIGTEKR
jgi:hypothetical protein